MDLGYNGTKFTWANNHYDNTHIKERIDRFCANSNWINTFPRYINNHLLRYSFDHCPIVLEFHDTNNISSHKNNSKIQRFEQLWAQDKECTQIVEQTWKSTVGSSPIKLHHTLHQMATRGRRKFGDIPSKIKSLQAYLDNLKNSSQSRELVKYS